MSKNLSGNPAKAAQQRAESAAEREAAARKPKKKPRATAAKQRLQTVRAKLKEPAAAPPPVYDRATDPRFAPGQQTVRAGLACLFTGGMILVVCLVLLIYSVIQLGNGGDPTTNGFARAAALAGGGLALLLIAAGIISVVMGKRRVRNAS